MALKDWLKTTLALSDETAERYAQWFTANRFPIDAARLPQLNLEADQRTTIENALELLSITREQREAREIRRARTDLVERFVAVAISVGFATSLSGMRWLRRGDFPTPLEWPGLIRLLTALFVIITGWEWFHRDIERNPSTSWLRFLVDIAVVIASLIFLLSYQAERLWLYSLGMIFLLYVVWDALSGRNVELIANSIWFVYFLLLTIITIAIPLHERDIAITECLFVIGGVTVLRWEGGQAWLGQRAQAWLGQRANNLRWEGAQAWLGHLIFAVILAFVYLIIRYLIRAS